MNFAAYKEIQYRIITALDEGMVMDSMPDNGNTLAIYKWHQGPNQRWNIMNHGDGKFSFFNVMDCKAITAPVNPQKQSRQIQCKISKKTYQQIFHLSPCTQEPFQQKNAFYILTSTGSALDVCEGRAKNGQNVKVWDLNKTQKVKNRLNQIWMIEPVSFIPDLKAQYKIFSSLDYGMVWDASRDGSDYDNLILYPCHKGTNQKFTIQYCKGKYLIINRENQGSVQVSNGSQDNQAKLKVGKLNKLPHELWQIIPCTNNQFKGKGAYYLRSHCGKYVDISNGQAFSSAPIIQWDYNGNNNQIWFIHKV